MKQEKSRRKSDIKSQKGGVQKEKERKRKEGNKGHTKKGYTDIKAGPPNETLRHRQKERAQKEELKSSCVGIERDD